jgi:thiaminase
MNKQTETAISCTGVSTKDNQTTFYRITEENAVSMVIALGWTFVNSWEGEHAPALKALVNHVYADNGESLPQVRDSFGDIRRKMLAEAATTSPDCLIKARGIDISWRTALEAHRQTSWTPEARAYSHLVSYCGYMEQISDEFKQWLTDENRAAMIADLETYRAQYVKLYQTWLHSHSNIVSQGITGAGGWTPRMLRSQEKKHRYERNHAERLEAFDRKRLNVLRGRYNPRLIAKQPIRSSDADAIERLSEKIAAAQELQDVMKECNKIMRRYVPKLRLSDNPLTEEKRTELLSELKAFTGYADSTVHKLLTQNYMGKIGFESWELSNNNANIRRMQKRIVEIERIQAKPASSDERPDGLTIERAPAENRLRLYFPGKPSEATRAALKQNGFRWARSIGAWSAYMSADNWKLDRVIAAWEANQ